VEANFPKIDLSPRLYYTKVTIALWVFSALRMNVRGGLFFTFVSYGLFVFGIVTQEVILPPKISAERTPANHSAERPIRERQLAAYYRAADYIEGLQVLEIGCGEGIGPSLLSRKAASMVALDYSEEAICIARSRYGDCGIEFQLMRVPPIKFSAGSFDAIICFQMIEHLKEPEELVVEIKRVLKEDGVALIATVNKEETITENPYHLHEFGANELETLLKKHFATVEMSGVFGDEVFTRYWEENRRWVSNFMRLDICGLSRRLPRKLKAYLFDSASRLMRARLKQRNPHLCSEITHRNFVFRPNSFDGCLDFFAVCKK
jgi:SAM-dependent methyltransferase